MEKIIDLHVHSNLSDGEYSPKEIIDMAVKNNVKVLSIADHDTIDAYNEELFKYAELNNILLIPAVEISTKINKCGIHVLGYNFNLNDENLKEKLYLLKNSRHMYLKEVSAKLIELGYKVEVEKLDEIKAVTKAHIATNIISNEENKKKLLKEFNHIPNKGEFIETIMNEGCPAYVKKETITPIEAAKLIKSANGKVVLAHPVAYKYEDNLTDEEILNLIKEMRIQAIEGNYIYVDRNNSKIDECKKWNEFAKKNNLISTIGSDFHNEDGLRPIIGLVNENINLSNEDIKEIIEFIK